MAVLAVLLPVVALGVWLLREPAAPERVPAPPLASLAPDASAADDFARAACVRLRLVKQGIRADTAAGTVRRELASARVLAAEALRRDGRWAALSGGIAALDEAIRTDDPFDARTALQVAARECTALP